MTLLHQAAQKAVEALKSCETGGYRDIDGDWAVTRWYDNAKVKAAIAALESALQQQPEPVAWIDLAHINAHGKVHGLVVLSEAQAPRTVPLYTTPPALQHQEEPREPVATEPECKWPARPLKEVQVTMPNGSSAVLAPERAYFSAWAVQELENRFKTASPSTTRQQEVGSGVQYRHKRTGGLYAVIGTAKLQTDKPLFDMAEVVAYRGEDGRVWVRAAAEFDERFERAAAPSTPENADGVKEDDRG